MSKVSRESAPEVVDYGPVEDRTDHFHGVGAKNLVHDLELDLSLKRI